MPPPPHADKSAAPSAKAVAGHVSQKANEQHAATPLTDNRPETLIQRKLQEMANKGDLKALHSPPQQHKKAPGRRTPVLSGDLRSGFEQLGHSDLSRINPHANEPVVQGLFGNNTAAVFRTSQDSIYNVTAGGLIRYRMDDRRIRGDDGKNIFYVGTAAEGADLDDELEHWRDTAWTDNGASISIKFEYTADESGDEAGELVEVKHKKAYTLTRNPVKNLYPVDMFLTNKGLYDGSFHYGHKITEIPVSAADLKAAREACEAAEAARAAEEGDGEGDVAM